MMLIPSSSLVSLANVKTTMAREVVVSFIGGLFVVSWVDAGDNIRAHKYLDLGAANYLAGRLKGRDR